MYFVALFVGVSGQKLMLVLDMERFALLKHLYFYGNWIYIIL